MHFEKENNSGCRCTPFVIDHFSKNGFCVQLEEKASQSITTDISKNFRNSDRKPTPIETAEDDK